MVILVDAQFAKALAPVLQGTSVPLCYATAVLGLRNSFEPPTFLVSALYFNALNVCLELILHNGVKFLLNILTGSFRQVPSLDQFSG